jgi:hypothetical protein
MTPAGHRGTGIDRPTRVVDGWRSTFRGDRNPHSVAINFCGEILKNVTVH